MNLRGFLLAATVLSALAPLPVMAQDVNNPRIIIRRSLPGTGTISPSTTGVPVGSLSAVCGSADGTILVSNPTTDQLCSSGTASSISVAETTYSWSCTLNGSTSSCSATRVTPANGSCGTAQGGATVPPPITNLCSSGSSTAIVTNASTYDWSCIGPAGGATASCSSVRLIPVNGVCGTSNNGATSSVPSSGLCSAGNPTAVLAGPTAGTTGTNAFSWQCAGINTGTTSSCASNAVISAVCGSVNATNTAVTPSSAAQCNVGSPSTVVSTPSNFTWTCAGPYGGVTSSCNANRIANGVCGASNGDTTPYAPTTGICSLGTPSALATNASTYNWSCSGINGGSATACSGFRNASVGPAHLSSSVTSPIFGLCSIGNASAVTSSATSYNWTCSNGSDIVNGSATRLYVINGSCGAANGTNTPTSPMTGLCGTGAASSVSDNGATFDWSCLGVNGGSNSSCFSNKLIAGVCGASNGGTFASVPGGGICNIGPQSAIATNASTFNWTCAGVNGGATSNCVGFRTATLGPAHGTSSVASPTSGLCTIGTASSVTANPATFNWTCSNGSSVLNGSASRLFAVNGACGLANNTNTPTTPVSGLCNSGNVTVVSDGGSTYNWSCLGENGGSNAGCFSSKSVSGVCGASNGGTFATAPASAICNAGNQSAVVTNASTYTWTCFGVSGGSTASCSGFRNSELGPVHGTSSVNSPVSGLCTIGTPSAVTANPTTYNWACSNGSSVLNGSAIRLYSVNGTCGLANNTNTPSTPLYGLCGTGTSSVVSENSTTFDWSCLGANGGSNASCFSNKPLACYNGSPAKIKIQTPIELLSIESNSGHVVRSCLAGSYTASVNVTDTNGINKIVSKTCNLNIADVNNPYYYECASTPQIINGISHELSFTSPVGEYSSSFCNLGATLAPDINQACGFSEVTVNGSCGIKHTTTSSVPPLTLAEYCSAGIPTPSSNEYGILNTWSCLGTNGGSPSSCYSNTSSFSFSGINCIVPFVIYFGGGGPGGGSTSYPGCSKCGPASGTISSVIPSSGLCATGNTPSPVVSYPNGYIWSCEASGNPSDFANCSAARN